MVIRSNNEMNPFQVCPEAYSVIFLLLQKETN
ncbi:hypothetical protein MITS9509_01779 [Synechococcus sp. MIT S9509]|nr:hypothetical protein MITS9504_03419 [Synechococcus sp. MIT S9504]KZR91858.1 hypothetical protein MITS9509_01779 [Synechococcus sp. MIT S9509]